MSIKIRDFSKNYGDKKLFENFNLEMKKGEIIEISGETGKGKTTLKRCIAGLEDYSGDIDVQGDIAFVFQDVRTLPWLNVRKNITISLKLKGEEINEQKTREIEKLAERLGIKEHLDKNIEEVSGGQLQRILLSRALITNPGLLILDEPFNSLDRKTREQIYREVTEICSERNISVLIASHTSGISKFADRTVDLDSRSD